jgi:acyl-CoA thioester hydrolase
MYVSTTQARVRYAETDQMGIVYYGNYAQYFEIGRVESMRQLGYSYKEMEKEGVILPVVEMHIKYLRSAVYDDLLTIKTTLQEMPHDHRITFLQEVFNEAGKLLTSGHVTLYFLDTVTRKRTIMPKVLKDKLASYFAEVQ